MKQPDAKQRGFTIIELMITLVVMAILISLAVPSFQGSFRRAHVDTIANSLLIGLATARAEAIRRGSNVKLCASANPSTSATCGLGVAEQGGWIVFIDTDNSDAVNGAEEIIKVGAPAAVTTTATTPIGAGSTTGYTVTFDKRGTVSVGSGSLDINATGCATGKDKQITVTLNTVGRTQSTVGVCP